VKIVRLRVRSRAYDPDSGPATGGMVQEFFGSNYTFEFGEVCGLKGLLMFPREPRKGAARYVWVPESAIESAIVDLEPTKKR